MTTEEQEAYLNTPEEIILRDEYEKYVEFGDPFFREGLTFEQWKDTRDRILRDMTKWGSD